jgi:hypothetical protein
MAGRAREEKEPLVLLTDLPNGTTPTTLLSLAEAARILPNRPHVSTVWRWYRPGVKGKRLQTVSFGGRRYTAPGYLAEFIAKLSEPVPEAAKPVTGLRTVQMARAAERAEGLF